jgi:hypothetical protein
MRSHPWWSLCVFWYRCINNIFCFLMKAIQPYYSHKYYSLDQNTQRDHHGCDRMTVGFTTPCAISAYHQYNGSIDFQQQTIQNWFPTTGNTELVRTGSLQLTILNWFPNTKHTEGPSWMWSHDSWIYNSLCNQCLSPTKLWVRIPLMARFSLYYKQTKSVNNRKTVKTVMTLTWYRHF